MSVIEDVTRLQLRVTALRNALEAIKKSTVEGNDRGDVAWFDKITTLHDYCEQALQADTP